MGSHRVKELLKSLSRFGIEINHSLDVGVSLFGLNVSRSRHRLEPRSASAFRAACHSHPAAVLDVGSGGGEHARAFAEGGANVTCVDLGSSIYAERAVDHCRIRRVAADFGQWTPDRQYDLVWASHVLEHQRNVGSFIDKLISCCAPGGKIAIIVPVPHRRLWGGHLTLWTPGLLAYNIALSGIDLSTAQMGYGYREIWTIFSPVTKPLPDLTYDSGDIEKLSSRLPLGFRENGEPWPKRSRIGSVR